MVTVYPVASELHVGLFFLYSERCQPFCKACCMVVSVDKMRNVKWNAKMKQSGIV